MDKELFVEMLKELFAEGRISLDIDNFSEYGGKGIELKVDIDNKEVYSTRLYTDNWLD